MLAISRHPLSNFISGVVSLHSLVSFHFNPPISSIHIVEICKAWASRFVHGIMPIKAGCYGLFFFILLFRGVGIIRRDVTFSVLTYVKFDFGVPRFDAGEAPHPAPPLPLSRLHLAPPLCEAVRQIPYGVSSWTVNMTKLPVVGRRWMCRRR